MILDPLAPFFLSPPLSSPYCDLYCDWQHHHQSIHELTANGPHQKQGTSHCMKAIRDEQLYNIAASITTDVCLFGFPCLRHDPTGPVSFGYTPGLLSCCCCHLSSQLVNHLKKPGHTVLEAGLRAGEPHVTPTPRGHIGIVGHQGVSSIIRVSYAALQYLLTSSQLSRVTTGLSPAGARNRS